MRILVLGASGMLGNAVLRVMSEKPEFEVYGAVRSPNALLAELAPKAKILPHTFAEDTDSLLSAFMQARPNVVINCIGLVKQLSDAEDPLAALPLNSMLPHRLARMCSVAGARLVHMSTDCVFDGQRGGYLESDITNAVDVYGRSKALGEVTYPHTITLRTSIIGRELAGARSLVGWFLSQEGTVRGFTNAIFSGLPTVELARIIRDYVLPREDLSGLYHVAAEAISKHELLTLIAKTYEKSITIKQDDSVRVDRSLNSQRFQKATGYHPPSWPELIQRMHAFH